MLDALHKLVAEVNEKVTEAAEKGASFLWNKAKEAGGELADAAKEKAGELKDKFDNSEFGKAANELGDALKNAADRKLDNAAQVLSDKWDKVKDAGGEVLDAVKGSAAYQTLESGVDQLKATASNAAEGVKTAASNLADSALTKAIGVMNATTEKLNAGVAAEPDKENALAPDPTGKSSLAPDPDKVSTVELAMGTPNSSPTSPAKTASEDMIELDDFSSSKGKGSDNELGASNEATPSGPSAPGGAPS
jgi:hypothetical protein